MDLINIQNKNLANYIMFKLDKLDNEFTEQELEHITEVVIDYNDETDSSFVFLGELSKFKNLKSITLRNGYIYNDNYNLFLKLEYLEEFEFENCEFENADLIASLNLKSLSLINCKIESYTFISVLKELEQLSIINGKVETSKLNMLKNLKYLQLSYSDVIGIFELSTSTLEELYIDNTNIAQFNFLNNMPNLKRISIDEKQYEDNKNLFDNLLKNNVLVLNENMTLFSGEDNEI